MTSFHCSLRMILAVYSLLTPISYAYQRTCPERSKTINKKGKGTACPQGDFVIQGLTSDEKDVILEIHNNYRQELASGNVGQYPRAYDMQEMAWNDDLAELAQNHAQQCQFKHDDRLCRLLDGESTGQNLAFVRNSVGFEWRFPLKRWWDEYEIYSPYRVSNFDASNSKWMHFTQMAWASTNRIGCGFVAFNLTDGFINPYRLYVCNYAGGGNIANWPIYETDSRKSCRKKSRKYPALCASGVHDNVAGRKQRAAVQVPTTETTTETPHIMPPARRRKHRSQPTHSSAADCRDKEGESQCEDWAEHGYCVKHSESMNTHCCGTCRSIEQKRRSAGSERRKVRENITGDRKTRANKSALNEANRKIRRDFMKLCLSSMPGSRRNEKRQLCQEAFRKARKQLNEACSPTALTNYQKCQIRFQFKQEHNELKVRIERRTVPLDF